MFKRIVNISFVSSLIPSSFLGIIIYFIFDSVHLSLIFSFYIILVFMFISLIFSFCSSDLVKVLEDIIISKIPKEENSESIFTIEREI